MRRNLFTFLAAASLLLFLATTALLVRSWFVYEHLATATNSGPAWVLRSFHGRLTLDHRSYWTAQSGFTWGRRRISLHENPANYLYQAPKRRYGFFATGFYSGTSYIWPGHLYPTVTKIPDLTDPRFWRDDYSALLVPDLLPICLFAILPLLYLRNRLPLCRPHLPTPATGSPGRVPTILAATSFLLLLFLSDLWPQTYTSGHLWYRGQDRRFTEIVLFRNQFHLTTGSYRPTTSLFPVPSAWQHTDFSSYNGIKPPTNLLERAGFVYQSSDPRFTSYRHIALPLWPLTLLCTVLPVRLLLTHHRLRRRHLRLLRNQCQSCGYNLSGAPTPICPECGTTTAKPTPLAQPV